MLRQNGNPGFNQRFLTKGLLSSGFPPRRNDEVAGIRFFCARLAGRQF